MRALSNLQTSLGRLRVGQQLGAAFGLVLVLAAALGAVAVFALSRVEAQAEHLSGK